jgi:hypothetical protein
MRWMVLGCFMVLAAGCGSDDNRVNQADALPDTSVVDALDATTSSEVGGEIVEEVVAEITPDIPVEPVFPARELPFVFTREAEGEDLTDEEVASFTSAVTGLWKDVDFFRWVLRTSTGVDHSTGMDDFLGWYRSVKAIKAGSTVTFQQVGGDHNMWIPGSKMLSAAMNGCILTGDWEVCKVAEQYCKGLTASVKGFIWGDDDPAPYLMARAVFPNNHAFTLDEEYWQDDGREKVVDFENRYFDEFGWNAQSFAWPENPTWGSIWITNMRSKDDVCAISRTSGFLYYAVADSPYPWVQDACQETLDTMVGFHKDIVDSGYHIRTKDQEGKAYEITDQDLGNYVWYADVDPANECPARLATDLIAYGEPLTNDCGTGTGSLFDMLAPAGHYYNYPIVYDYHMAALLAALVHNYPDISLKLLEGMAERIDTYLDPNTDESGAEHPKWSQDMAVLLVKAASVGLPLTAKEARLVQKHWTQAVAELSVWPRWDLWDESVPDGEYDGGSGFRPSDSYEGIPVESIALLLEYCNSPFKNSEGARFVDCEAMADVTRWGE